MEKEEFWEMLNEVYDVCIQIFKHDYGLLCRRPCVQTEYSCIRPCVQTEYSPVYVPVCRLNILSYLKKIGDLLRNQLSRI